MIHYLHEQIYPRYKGQLGILFKIAQKTEYVDAVLISQGMMFQ